MAELRREVLRLLAGRPTEEAMAAELRRRGFVVIPPDTVERAEHEYPGFLDLMLNRDEEPSDG